MSYITALVDDFISLLFPRVCYGCGEHLLRNENLICTQCYVSIPRTNFHLDENNPVAQIFWGRCLIQKSAAFSFYERGSRIRKIIHALKYNGVKELGNLMGRIYAIQLKESGFFDGIDVIIPVPLHPSKQKKRGFNQSECICGGISEISGLPVNNSVLRRVSSSATQTRRSRYDRWLNVEGIFDITDCDALRDKHVLLVDDVITTGATIESCVTALMKIEGIKISVIALAWSSL
ncbi:MAG TPA: ComF family protein [Bacteroidales bacterium]|nr:ComF family protein [Bacteroidales bacterium]